MGLITMMSENDRNRPNQAGKDKAVACTAAACLLCRTAVGSADLQPLRARCETRCQLKHCKLRALSEPHRKSRQAHCRNGRRPQRRAAEPWQSHGSGDRSLAAPTA